MNCSTSVTRRTIRNKALVAAIVSALALGSALPAVAQTADYTLDTTAWTQVLQLQDYLHSVNNTQALTADATATLNGGDSIFDTFTGTGQPQTVSNNSIFALAKGNNATGAVNAPTLNDRSGNSIDMGLLGADATPNSGLGILSGQVNSANAVSTDVQGVSVATSLTGYTTGAVTQNDNQIRSDVRMNDASNAIAGDLPAATFAGTTDGSTAITVDPSPTPSILQNAGDISIGNAQTNQGTTGSGAVLDNSGINIQDTVASSAATFSNSGNTIAASYVGNHGTSHVDVTGSDGAPTYNGSVVVSNGQGNLDAPADTDMDGNLISTTLSGNLTGSVTQSGDVISATTQGNDASNGIAFAQGLNIDGNAPTITATLAFAPNATSAQQAGDLVLLNAQGNNLGGGNFDSSLDSSVIQVQAAAATTAASSVTLHDDHAVAFAGGNRADNALSTDGASFDAYVAVGNQQANNGTELSAQVGGFLLRSDMTGTALSRGSVTVDAGSIEAGVQGNQASTEVSLAGTNFLAGAGPISVQGGTQLTATNLTLGATGPGVSVENLQGSFDTDATLGTENTDSWLGAHYAGGIAGGSTTVNDNAISAAGGANAASTHVALSGANGALSAALGNAQVNENSVNTYVGDATLGIEIQAGGVSNATLTVNANTTTASAHGNQASNRLSTAFSNLTLGDSAWGGSIAPSSAIMLDPFGTTTNMGQAALLLTSTQVTSEGDFDAEMDNAWMGVYVDDGNTSGTPVTVDGNQFGATAMANQVDNTLDPGVGTLVTGSGDITQVATLSTLQFANDNEVYAGSFGPGGLRVGGQFAGNLANSAVTVADNDSTLLAAGNVASNTVGLTGANFAADPLPAGTQVLNGLAGQLPGGILTSGPTAIASAAFTLNNMQASVDGGRAAFLQGNTLAGVIVYGTTNNSPLTISSNDASAAARDNVANSALSLTGFSTLTTTAALQNVQISSADMTGDNGNGSGLSGGIGAILSDTTTGSALTVNDNSLAASTLANVAGNRLAIDAAQLGGDGLDHDLTNAIGFGPPGTVSGALQLTLGGLGAFSGALADYVLVNSQQRLDGSGRVEAEVDTRGIGVTVSNGTLNGGSATVASNTTSAFAQVNSANNDFGLKVTRATATAALSNQQYVGEDNDTRATVMPDLGSVTDFAIMVDGAIGNATALPLTVSDNTLVAQAGLNDATNVLHASGTGSIDASNDIIMGAGSLSLIIFPLDVSGAVADYAVSNAQTAGSDVVASAVLGQTGILAGGSLGRNGQTTAATVDGNIFVAQAAVNSAVNAVELDGASSIGASTALSNAQLSGGDSADAEITASGQSSASVGVYTTGGDAIRNANLSVSGNSLQASASANSASNSIAVLPVALNAGTQAQLTGGSTVAVAGVLNGLGTGAAGSAINTLVNQQHSVTAVNASVDSSNIGINAGSPGLPSALLTSTATVSGNRATASASGNSAGNSIMLASLPTGVASSALVSNQLNVGDVTATAGSFLGGIQIGVNAGATSTSPVTVSGNAIGAVGVGNSATNHIGIGN